MKDFFIQQTNFPGILIWVLIIAGLLYRFNKKKGAKILLISGAVIFYIFSTAWLPRYMAYKLESQYAPLKNVPSFAPGQKVYIHLLGSGYQSDERLPATAKLCQIAQGRFTEAMRLYRSIPNSILVCSADGPPGLPTQAMVARQAAIDLGADSSRIITLNDPSTTKEEAQSLAKTVGVGAAVIVVTDAIHMPRAIRFFKAVGFSPLAAPANFRAINGSEGVTLKWWPSEENLYVTNRVLHEYFASIKGAF